ncbi:MAG: hypothetical protein L3J63_10815 [Geopsychrobacter sp.]|nr:hypothetical protein [Geopsychrobacter sp.]
MDKAIAMQVISWWLFFTIGKWVIEAALRKSPWGTRYQTEASCEACRVACEKDRNKQKSATLRELRQIRVLLIQLALRNGVEVEALEVIIQ